ncbi:YdeI/OmpD-associated family protein [Actinomadura sp. DC4]|uniref:YdeI/OmpD-associated family protein n=1 Tax=Actinomadura sp. DC4 TaxID=3055069 RepID=UPI0025AFC103|nr:YdeI/OmpD-associated family protein [Actinomadura sp. DC4]MDN3352046.1 YdeI/OmpD-associated family protein [Actinomadura sp. DC4]
MITINAHRVRATLHKMGGTYVTAVSNAVRQDAGVTAGDTVEVTIEPDTDEPDVEVPADLAAALAEAAVTEVFGRLTPFRRREMVDAVVSAKKADTRARRVGQAVARLAG